MKAAAQKMLDTASPLDNWFSPALFWRVKYLQDDAMLTQLPVLLWLVQQVQPAALAAIGGRSGAPYFALCQAVEKLNLASRCTSLQGDFHQDPAAVSYHQQQYSEFSQLHADVAFDGHKLDLVLLQSAELAVTAQAAVKSALHRGTVVFCNQPALPEWLPSWGDAASVSQLPCGQGVIAWQAGTYAVLDALHTQPQQHSDWMQALQHLGQACRYQLLASQSQVLQQQASEWQQRCQDQQADQQQLQQQLATQARRIEQQQQELAELALQQQQWQRDLQGAEQQRLQNEQMQQQLQQQLSEALQQNASDQHELQQRYSELASLTTQLEQQRRQHPQLAQYQAKAAQLQQQLEQQEHTLQEKIQQLQALQAKVEQANERTQQLEQQLSDQHQLEKNRYLAEFAHTQTKRQLHQYQQEVIVLTRALQQSRQQVASATLQRQHLQNELAARKATISWRIKQRLSRLARPLLGQRQDPKLARQKALVEDSGLFDASWYLQQYPDVADKGFEPLEHFLRFGGFEGRNPNAEFDSAWYISQYSDVAGQGMNPLVHYIKFGQQEGRAMNAGGQG